MKLNYLVSPCKTVLICFILDEEVARLESEIEEMKMHEKAASIKSKTIFDGLNRRLRDKAEENKKLKVKIKDLKIELLAETSDRKQVRLTLKKL